MKTIFKRLQYVLLFLPALALAQTTVTGNVTEQATSLSLPGVNVIVKNTTNGTSTDFDGNYSIDANNGDVLIFSYVGFENQEVPYTGQSSINVALTEDASQLDEVVIIGYGTAKKEDLTGAVDVISSKDFNRGNIVSTDQLLRGKASGVRITDSGGSPDSAPNIRIRGGASLNGNNSPLIVIDGVPLGNQNPAGVSNPLSLVNPNDIESFSILKDASATAIYGSRASNGVIIITTKKGTSGEVKFNFSSDISISSASDGLDMMNGSEFTRFIQEFYPDRRNFLGVEQGSVQTTQPVIQTIIDQNGDARDIYDSNWRDEIFRTAISSNTNFSARANLFEKIPFRGSIGYTNAEGLALTDDYERMSTAFKLSPKFLDNNLKVDANAKLVYVDKNGADSGGAIGSSISIDPTKPVFDNSPNNIFGGYYQNTIQTGAFEGARNPLSLLEQRDRPERVFRFLGNVELDYTMPFLPELKAVVNLGLDASRSKIKETFSENAAQTYGFQNDVFNPGVNYKERQHITNTTFDAYTQYTKNFEEGFLNKFDVQLGYAYQNFKTDGNQDRFIYNTTTEIREPIIDENNPNNRYFNELNLQSFLGRSNINIKDKYIVTLSLRADASSLFVGQDIWDTDVWGFFPAAAIAWKVKEESFLKGVNFVNDLKLRLSWGNTGQQDVTGVVGFYPSSPLFEIGGATSQYFPGANLYGALEFNDELTWEKTTTYNLGLDFDIFKNSLLSGSFEVYKRETTDLLSQVDVPAGQGLTNRFIDNVGKTESEGFELNLNLTPIQTENFTFSINSNLAYNKTEITDLEGADFLELPSNLRGTGTTLLYNAVGQQAGSAWVLKQVYDTAGNPIVGSFVDLNGDNQITDDDRYFEQIAPNWTYGFGLNFSYKDWDLSSSFRGQISGNVYNQNRLNFGFLQSAVPQNAQSLTNVLNFYDGMANTAFDDYSNVNVFYSDYFLEDATFLRCDNISLGKRFDNVIKNASLRLYGSVNNPFIITDYSGQDPENFGGIDGTFYPRPVTYTFGMNIDF